MHKWQSQIKKSTDRQTNTTLVCKNTYFNFNHTKNFKFNYYFVILTKHINTKNRVQPPDKHKIYTVYALMNTFLIKIFIVGTNSFNHILIANILGVIWYVYRNHFTLKTKRMYFDAFLALVVHRSKILFFWKTRVLNECFLQNWQRIHTISKV